VDVETESGKLKAESGELKTESGKWKTENCFTPIFSMPEKSLRR
jgi:hypothetical protein